MDGSSAPYSGRARRSTRSFRNLISLVILVFESLLPFVLTLGRRVSAMLAGNEVLKLLGFVLVLLGVLALFVADLWSRRR